MQPVTANPLYIRMHADDNVAIVANRGGLHPGAEFACGLRLIEQIPQGHKVALADIAEGDIIRRYGEVIGHAAAPIACGSWVKEALVRMPDAPSFDNLPRPTAARSAAAAGGLHLRRLSQCRRLGRHPQHPGDLHQRAMRRRHVEFALDRIRKELLPKYPNVDDVVAITHAYGCGVAINAPDAAVPIRTLRNLARNPEFRRRGHDRRPRLRKAAAGTAAARRHERRRRHHAHAGRRPHGFGEIVEDIVQMADARLQDLNRRRRDTCPASALVVGLQCGGSDAFSGVTANPALGFAADLLVRAGATVMFSEVTEVRDAIHLLTPRAASQDVARRAGPRNGLV